MGPSKKTATFHEAVEESVPSLDEHLAELNVPLPERPLRAAFLFVDAVILDIKGDTKDGFYKKPWFRDIFGVISRWYEDRYGAALHRLKTTVCGAVLFSGVAFGVDVPLTLRRPGPDGVTMWLVFPIDVQPEEDPIRWLHTPPKLSKLRRAERRALHHQVTQLGTGLRRIHNDLMTAAHPDDIARHLAASIVPHLEAAAQHLLATDLRRRAMSAWESHQAAEAALKAVARHIKNGHAKTHELQRLLDDLPAASRPPVKQLIARLPTARQAIDLRAGEGPPLSIEEAFDFYNAAVELTVPCVRATRHKLRLRNAAFLLGQPPWLPISERAQRASREGSRSTPSRAARTRSRRKDPRTSGRASLKRKPEPS